MAEKERSPLQLSLKGAALIKMVEAGLIPQEEDGSVDTQQFEVFWRRFEPDIDTAFSHQAVTFRALVEDVRNQERGEGREEPDRPADERVLSRLNVGELKLLTAFLGCFAAFLLLLAVLR